MIATDQDDCSGAAPIDNAAFDRYLDTMVDELLASGLTRQEAYDVAYPMLDAAIEDGSYLAATSW